MGSYIPPEYLQYFEYLPDLQKCANVFITFTPMFSYGTTCYGIYKKKTSLGFSIDICATMLMASILRICYYTISPFEISLLRQSMVMIFIQCILLKISLNYRPVNYNPELLTPLPIFKNELNSYLPRRLSQTSNITQHDIYQEDLMVLDFGKFVKSYIVIVFSHCLKFFDVYYKRPGLFWQWVEEKNYWVFLVKFLLVFITLTFIFINNEYYGSFIGILGLFIESLLPLPQILLLNRLKSIKNFKILLLLSWLGGDLTKLSYLLFGTNNISIIFIIAALFQMSLDIIIAFQYFHFKNLDFDNLNLSLPNYKTPKNSANEYELDPIPFTPNSNLTLSTPSSSSNSQNYFPSIEGNSKFPPVTGRQRSDSQPRARSQSHSSRSISRL